MIGIIIRGLSAPKGCGSCRFNNSDLRCSITKSEIDRDFLNDKLADCPITEILLEGDVNHES